MQYCTFTLNDRLYGVDVLKVQEVIRHHEMTRIPLAPGVVRGLMNLRGNIVATLDMRRQMGMAALEDEQSTINIITRSANGLVSLMVDQIGDVVDLDESESEALPGTVQSEARQFTDCVYKLKTGLLQILDPDRIAAVEPVDLRAEGRR